MRSADVVGEAKDIMRECNARRLEKTAVTLPVV